MMFEMKLIPRDKYFKKRGETAHGLYFSHSCGQQGHLVTLTFSLPSQILTIRGKCGSSGHDTGLTRQSPGFESRYQKIFLMVEYTYVILLQPVNISQPCYKLQNIGSWAPNFKNELKINQIPYPVPTPDVHLFIFCATFVFSVRALGVQTPCNVYLEYLMYLVHYFPERTKRRFFFGYSSLLWYIVVRALALMTEVLGLNPGIPAKLPVGSTGVVHFGFGHYYSQWAVSTKTCVGP